MSLEINVVEKKDNVFLVNLKGSLDSDTSKDLKTSLKEIIKQETKAVILDMGGLDYISSVGIGVVMWAKKTLEEQYNTFAMVNLQPKIKNIFDVMKLLPIMNIFQEMPEADKYIDQIINEEMQREDI